ncbi:MAG: thioredoxin [Deltaproteobacteria bacterium]|nr:thioredoxin [Deltaproteobacteria bacterium]
MNAASVIIRCKNCGVKNRIPKTRLKDQPVCGRCHSRLPERQIFDSPVIVSDHNFNDEIISSPVPVLLDCWAPWCGACKTVGPVLVQLAKEFGDQVKFGKLNVDQNPATSAKYNIMSIPTILAFKDGKLVNSLVGALPKAEIVNQLRALL